MIGEHKFSEVVDRLEDIFQGDLVFLACLYVSEMIQFTSRSIGPEYVFSISYSDYYDLECPEDDFEDGFETLDDLMLYLAHHYA